MSHEIRPIKIILIPGWVYRATLNNKLNITDLSDYNKMRDVLSANDIAEYASLNYMDIFATNNQINLPTDRGMGLFHQSDNVTEERASEIRTTILPLSGHKETYDNVKLKLSMPRYSTEVEYRFICTNDTIYIILSEGVLSVLVTDEQKLTFIKEYLRNCYSMMPIVTVSNLPIFKHYINLLAKTAKA